MISSSVCTDGPGYRSSSEVKEVMVSPEGHHQTHQRHSYEDVLEGFLLHKPPHELYGLHNGIEVLPAEEMKDAPLGPTKRLTVLLFKVMRID